MNFPAPSSLDHLVLIDGHHLMYRAYWAIPRTLRTRSGEQTNAVFGFASMLLTILNTEEPDALLICFDAGKDTFRHQEHTEYKAGRAETPDDFYVQIPRIQQCVEAFSLPNVADPKYEADDLLGSYATAATAAGMRTTIVTGDRDALQLATDTVRVAIPHKGYQQAEYLGPEEVVTKYGIRPDQVAAYKGLSGDSSDNLPGVRGIGPKTAAKLLQEYDTLEGVYNNIDNLKGSVKTKLETDKESAFFCERMAQLITDIDTAVPLELLTLDTLPSQSIQEFFQELEFTLLIRRLRSFIQTPYGQQHFVPLEDVEVQDPNSQLAMF